MIEHLGFKKLSQAKFDRITKLDNVFYRVVQTDGSEHFYIGNKRLDDVQVDWNQLDSTGKDFIKNKPETFENLMTTDEIDQLIEEESQAAYNEVFGLNEEEPSSGGDEPDNPETGGDDSGEGGESSGTGEGSGDSGNTEEPNSGDSGSENTNTEGEGSEEGTSDNGGE